MPEARPCSAPHPHPVADGGVAAVSRQRRDVQLTASADGQGIARFPLRIRNLLPGLAILQSPRNPRYDTNGGPVIPDRAATELVPALLSKANIQRDWPKVIVANAVIAEGPVWDALAALSQSGAIKRDVITTWERAMLERGAAPDAESYVAAFMSGSQRKRLRQKRRVLEEAGPLSLDIQTSPDGVDRGLAAFCALEHAGWKGRNGTALTQDAAGHAYVADVLASMAPQDGAFTAVLTAGGRVVAAGLFLKAEGDVVFWKTTYDETLARQSPGVIFDLMLTDWLYGQAWFRRLDTGHDDSVDPGSLIWKQRRRMANIVIDLAPGSLKGRCVVALLSLRARLRAWKNRRSA